MPPPRSDKDRAAAPAPPKAFGTLSSEHVLSELEVLEVQFQQLRARYEQYFLGMEKRPPLQAHAQFKDRLAPLQAPVKRTAGLSFRLQSLRHQVSTYERLWARTLQEMEDGTYRRDVFKLRRKNSSSEVPAAKLPKEAPDPEKVAAPPPEVAPPPPAPAPRDPPIHIAGSAPPDPLSETRLRSVYRAYVEAKRRCNEDTTRLSFDAVASSLRKQVPELLERHQARDVEYRVFVKDGKAILRAVPKV